MEEKGNGKRNGKNRKGIGKGNEWERKRKGKAKGRERQRKRNKNNANIVGTRTQRVSLASNSPFLL